MKDSARTILFAACLAVACAGLLTAANRLLADRQKANEQAERLRNIFTVLAVQFDENAPSKQLLELAKTLQERQVKLDGKDQTFFVYDHPNDGRLMAFEFNGPGLWGPVYGLLCLKADLQTIFRVSFYKHQETPGLGGEIGSDTFREPFENLAVPPGKVLRVGGKDAPRVDAISGATMTCDKVEEMLNKTLRRIQAGKDILLAAGTAETPATKEATHE